MSTRNHPLFHVLMYFGALLNKFTYLLTNYLLTYKWMMSGWMPIEDLHRWLIANMDAPVPVPAPVQGVPTVAELRQRLVAQIQSLEPKPTPDQTVVIERGCPGSGPSSGADGE